jgi:hypothetical protein
MKQLWHRIRGTLKSSRVTERRTAESDVAADPHQVTGRPETDAKTAGQVPGTTATGASGSFVGRVSGDETDGGEDGAEVRAQRDPDSS